jgi:hypothetical protein
MDFRNLKPRDLALNLSTAFMWIAEVSLALRVLFRLLDVEGTNGLAKWIYDVSSAFLTPLRGVFPVETVGTGNVLDVPALFAMVVYALFAMLVVLVVARLTVKR